jgi:pseudaminic acid cytidylyltransferase
LTICVIPARGGSKRIPRKNIKSFCGKPMIQWSIEAAQKSGIFDEIIVSTDDDEIKYISEKLGAYVPFIRPSSLSDDYTTSVDVVAHATNWALDNNLEAEIVCCIYATAPFVRQSDLINAFKIINSENWSYVLSVGEYSSPILRSFKQGLTGGLEMYFPENFEKRSQDLEPALFDAGMFYMGTSEAWIQKLKIFGNHSYPYKIPHWRIQDIDTSDDWIRAEILAQNLETMNIKNYQL